MGVWGYGVFESDSALDFLGNLVDSIKRLIAEDAAAAGDGVLERQTLAAVACLRAIMREIPEARVYLSRDEVHGWSQAYLGWFDANAPELGAEQEALREMRQNAEREFQMLQEQLEG